MSMEFKPFAKMARLSRECLVLEKIDGSNASVTIAPAYTPEGATDAGGSIGTFDNFIVWAGSRTRWIQPGKSTDNFGFAAWVLENVTELLKLGPGTHFGEYYGRGIQRHYNLQERRFALFNAGRWANPEMIETLPACCSVVPVLYRGVFTSDAVEAALAGLKEFGSRAVPGFRDPEGIIVYHVAAGIAFKKTLGSDGAKGVDTP